MEKISTAMSESSKSSTRNIRRVEAPRPLRKTVSEPSGDSSPLTRFISTHEVESVDQLLKLMDLVVEAISKNEENPYNTNGGAAVILTESILYLCKQIKIFGSRLERSDEGRSALDRACEVFRTAIIRSSLENQALRSLLDVLESRRFLWSSEEATEKVSTRTTATTLNLSKLKNFVKSHSVDNNSADVMKRVVIRNSDSGKVMGVKGRRVHMIEQLSDTIISFQRVTPAAKDRLVLISGANEGNVETATRLIRDTIQNNASPVRELPSSAYGSGSSELFSESTGYDELGCSRNGSGSLKDEERSSFLTTKPYYTHKIHIDDSELTITGDEYSYVTIAKAVLDDYFADLVRSAKKEAEKGSSCTMTTLDSTLRNSMDSVFETSAQRESSNVLKRFESRKIDPPVEFLDVSDALNSEEILSEDIVDNASSPTDSDPLVTPEETAITYTKDFMLKCRSSDLSREKPADWHHILSTFPDIVKVSVNPIVVEEYDISIDLTDE